MHRHGFTLLEVLIVLGIISVVGSVGSVMYRSYAIRSDLNIAAEQIAQAISRARLLAQSGKNDDSWGFNVPNSTLFQGASYASRVTTADEVYTMSPTITKSGLQEVVFMRFDASPSATGTILLTALTGDQRSVSIIVTSDGVTTNDDDRLTICHCSGGSGSDKSIPEAAWPGHSGHGDHLGACTGAASECD